MPKFPLISIVQMRSSEDKMENLELSVDFIREAAKKKSNLICFPEFQMAYSPESQSANQLSEIAESVNDGNFITTLRKAAKVNKISIISTIYEKSNNGSDNRVYDTVVLIDSKGEISSVYRKLHLYDALGFKESDKMMAGNMIEKPVKTSVGNIGLMICYDIRFPEMSRILTVKGANVLVSPSAWVHGVMKEEHWQTLLKARAIENGLYIIAPDQVGNIFSGRSMAVDPFGVVLLDMGNREGMEVVELDKSRVQKVRELLPLLKNRRTDVYGDNISVFS
ncbi:MAG TPA: carbon-nitrogen hydrolase family protein [Nitrososphaeraceae archaeon]|jgi:deaminated glutathione amidase|nr:carbon-nitrogen hydrolase family protein [Thermoproteota archaeon]HZA64234.1 carbon-nitrogen hydrolase family protein [Nitrososphaeraceae archaeon]